LCTATSWDARQRRGPYRYVQCSLCGLAYVLNPPLEAELLAQYNSGTSSKLSYYRLAANADARTFNALLLKIEQYEPGGRILDIGCNIGTFVRVAGDRGWVATGVDVNIEAVNYGKRLGLDVRTVEELGTKDLERFDVIHSSDTIEHFADPKSSISHFLTRCKPNVLVALSTPNYDSALARALQLKPTEHVILFNPASFRRFLSDLNLDLVEMFPFDRYRNLSAMFESTTFDHFPQLKHVFKALHRVAPNLIVRIPGGENVVALARKPSAAKHRG
jgi:2-polyprenyl-3-methyl-5-hydroxy-6-metoxy-1,4-benzoquinol methylase